MESKVHISVVMLYILCGLGHITMRALCIYLLRCVCLRATGVDKSVEF